MAKTSKARGKTRNEAKNGRAKSGKARNGEAKSEAFLLRLSKDEKKMLGEKSRSLGLEPSAFLRMLIRISDVSWVEKLLQAKGVI